MIKNFLKAFKKSKGRLFWQPCPLYASSPEQKQEFIAEILEILNHKIKIKK